MQLWKLSQENPKKLWLSISLTLLSIFGLIYKWHSWVDRSPSDQSDFEQVFRMFAGIMVFFMPYIVIVTLGYWIMHWLKKPTDKDLNKYLFIIFNVILILKFIFAVMYVNNASSNSMMLGRVSTLFNLLFIGIFVYNIARNVTRRPKKMGE